MRLFYHDETEPQSYERVVEQCQKVYGIEHPERVHGFDAFFYRLMDIYLYGKLEKWVEQDPNLEQYLNEFIRRFKMEDYGFVTRDEADLNLENRWLCGSCCWAKGRYSFPDKDMIWKYGGIVLEFFNDRGFMYSVDEDMTEIRAKYS